MKLANNSGHDNVYAYISGSDSSGWPVFVSANGALNRLPNPSSPVTPIADYSIPLGASGSAGTTVNLNDYVIGGRVWFSVGQKLQFFVNPGTVPGLVQPALVSSDPNWATNWTFCEFTFNSANLYANISYVDMVALPVSMASTGSGGSQSVSPLPSGALASIASGLQAQHASDGAPWDRLVVTDSSGAVLRVMAPSHSPVDFGGYWDDYLNRVWSHYASTALTVNGQGSIGSYTGTVSGGAIVFSGLNTNGVPFTKPSAVDIFGCASGPLYNSGSDARGAIAARLAAALNRSSLLVSGGNNQPDGVTPSQYYQDAITNHYARLVHQYASIGYAFPYDDVGATGSAPVDGHIQDGAPTSWTITLGAGSGSGPGGPGPGTVSAYGTIQAESYSAQNGPPPRTAPTPAVAATWGTSRTATGSSSRPWTSVRLLRASSRPAWRRARPPGSAARSRCVWTAPAARRSPRSTSATTAAGRTGRRFPRTSSPPPPVSTTSTWSSRAAPPTSPTSTGSPSPADPRPPRQRPTGELPARLCSSTAGGVAVNTEE